MHIAYLSASTIPSQAANAVQVMKMCDAFAQLGHRVTLLAKPPRQELPSAVDPFAFYRLTPSFEIQCPPQARGVWPLRRLQKGWSYRRLLRQQGCELLYARSLSRLRFSLSLDLPFVFEAHEPFPNRPELAALLRHPRCRLVVVISHALAEEYRRRFDFLSPQRLLVAHDGASWAGAPSPVPPRSEGEPLRVVYVGSLLPGKGMEIIAPLAERCPWAHFAVVGGSSEAVAHWRGALAGQDNIAFHGFKAHSETTAYLRHGHVLIAPYSQRVGAHNSQADIAPWMSPLKLFEYMAQGRPIVASRLPVLEEVLRHGDNALLARPSALAEWVEALQRLQQSPTLRQRLGEAAFRDFDHHYTWEQRAKRILSAIEAL